MTFLGGAFVVSALLALPACSDAPSRRAGEIRQPALHGAWTLDTRPRLRIGSEGDPLYEFDGIVAARMLATGDIIVVDGGSKQIRYYDRNGKFVRAAGRNGEGPGEFRHLTFASITQTGVVFTFDWRLSRVTQWNAKGRADRMWRLTPSIDGVWRPIGLLSERELLLREWRVPKRLWDYQNNRQPGFVAGSLVRDTIAFFATGTSGTGSRKEQNIDHPRVREIIRLPGAVRYPFHNGRIWTIPTVPFTQDPVVFAREGRLYWAREDSLQIVAFDSSGKVKQIFRGSAARKQVREEDLERVIEFKVGSSTDEHGRRFISPTTQQYWTRAYHAMPIPDQKPMVDQLYVDDFEYVWAREYRDDPAGELATRWWVFDRSGIVVARHVFPSRFQLFDIGLDHVLGGRRDEFGVEAIEIYNLNRGR